MFVDITAVTERDHRDNENVVIDRVNDAIVSNANTETGPPLECFGTRRPRLLTQECDRTTNAVAILMVDSLQRTSCGRTQLD